MGVKIDHDSIDMYCEKTLFDDKNNIVGYVRSATYSPTFKKVIPLELFTSNDQKFYFHTYLIAVENEFIPKLNAEHSGYCWTAFECWPKNLHGGLKNTLNNKAIKGKLQTILDLIV